MNNSSAVSHSRLIKQFGMALALSALVAGMVAIAATDTPKPAAQSLAALAPNSAVVSAAKAFIATLDDSQKKQTLLELAVKNATAWSNLPCGGSCRPGVRIGNLNDAQKAAAMGVLKAALSGAKNIGYDQVDQLLKADTYLDTLQKQGGGMGAAPNGMSGGFDPPGGGTPDGDGAPSGFAPPGGNGGPGGNFGPGMGGDTGSADGGFADNGPAGFTDGNYFLAFLGTPANSGTWQLHFGGHHLAVNITYQDGKVVSSTPEFVGVEPTSWTEGDKTYAPMAEEHSHMAAMLASLPSEQLAQAKLSTRFNDVLIGPQKDGRFPATKQGLQVSKLSAAQQKLVIAAMKPWVQDVDNATAEALMNIYTKELGDTYIAFSGNASLSNHADYVRIDGPSVWIELVCQSGLVIQNQIHYHSVWRDHQRDYGAVFSF